jgi:hypothetical protein
MNLSIVLHFQPPYFSLVKSHFIIIGFPTSLESNTKIRNLSTNVAQIWRRDDHPPGLRFLVWVKRTRNSYPLLVKNIWSRQPIFFSRGTLTGFQSLKNGTGYVYRGQYHL